MDVKYLLALHIIFVICWFAGLFYIVRLFVYFAEAESKPENEKLILQEQFKIMQRKLWYMITWPAMIGTYVFGFWMVFEIFGVIYPGWLVLKIAFVFGLTLYHLQCGLILNQQKNNIVKYSAFKMRLWNEVSTIFLVAIIFIVVLKDTLNWLYGIAGLVLLSVLLILAVRLYRKLRAKKGKV
ncbi:MAG: CopD family protein [Bacteroidetes bacterium]|nr:CopD family protein [Bacteroidota bacterium]